MPAGRCAHTAHACSCYRWQCPCWRRRKASAQAGTAAPAAPPTSISLAAAAESLRTRLLDAQLAGDAVAGQAALESAHRQYMVAFAEPFAAQAPAAAQRIEAGFAAATQGLATGDQAAVAAAKATIWTGVLDGAYRALLAAVNDGETAAAQRWLQVREVQPGYALCPARCRCRPSRSSSTPQASVDGKLRRAGNPRRPARRLPGTAGRGITGCSRCRRRAALPHARVPRQQPRHRGTLRFSRRPMPSSVGTRLQRASPRNWHSWLRR